MQIKIVTLLIIITITCLIIISCSKDDPSLIDRLTKKQSELEDSNDKAYSLRYSFVIKAMYNLKHLAHYSPDSLEFEETMDLFEKGGIDTKQAVQISLIELKLSTNNNQGGFSISSWLYYCSIIENSNGSKHIELDINKFNKNYPQVLFFVKNYGDLILKIQDSRMNEIKVMVLIYQSVTFDQIVRYLDDQMNIYGFDYFYPIVIKDLLQLKYGKDNISWKELDELSPELIDTIHVKYSNNFEAQRFIINILLDRDYLDNNQKLEILSNYLFKFGSYGKDMYNEDEYQRYHQKFNYLWESSNK